MAEDTPACPFGTVFTPNTWLDVPEGQWSVGEVPGAPRTWADGAPPYPVAGDGTVCGTAADFQGLGTVPAAPPPLNVYGGLACCHLPPSPFMHQDCHSCPAGAYDVYTLAVRGGTGFFAQYNGNFLMSYRGGCTWATNSLLIPGPPPRDVIWRFRALGTFPTNAGRVELLDLLLPLSPVYNSSLGYDCLEQHLIPRVGPLPTGSPPAVTVAPGNLVSNPNDCLVLSGATSAVYYLVVPFFVAFPIDLIRPRVGTYALFQSAPCEWTGEVVFVNGLFGRGGSGWPVTLKVDATGTATLTMSPLTGLLALPTGTFISPPAWAGNVPVALLLQPYTPGFIIYPVSVTINPPVLPP